MFALLECDTPTLRCALRVSCFQKDSQCRAIASQCTDRRDCFSSASVACTDGEQIVQDLVGMGSSAATARIVTGRVIAEGSDETVSAVRARQVDPTLGQSAAATPPPTNAVTATARS
jgi:hypothetical protein